MKEGETNESFKRIKTKNNLTLKELGQKVGMANNTLSQYETGKREPKLETWNKLAEYFNVPTSYLMGLSDDVNGWKEWAENTGYSVKQIKDEIQRLIKTKRLDSSANIQYQIGQAVKSLDSSSYSTTQGVQHELVFQLTTLINKVDNAFLEPQKKPKSLKYNPPQIRKDMDEKAYKKIIDVLTKAKYEIGQIPIDKKYL